MFPIRNDCCVKPDEAVKKGSVFEGLWDFWYSPTAWECYGHNLMNGSRYTEWIKNGKQPVGKKGWPDLVLVWKGIPWGNLTQDVMARGYRDDFPERNWYAYKERKYNNSEIKSFFKVSDMKEKTHFPIKVIDWQQDFLPNCSCQYCREERIRQRVLAKLEELRKRAEIREKLRAKLAEFDRMWDKLEKNGFVTPP
jgi:hypothetical protein